MNEGTEPGAPSPNEHQVRYILSTCEYIDRLLTDIEGVLNASASKSVFPRYSSDLTPVQRQTIEDFVACLRTRLVRILDDQGIGQGSASSPGMRHQGSLSRSISQRKSKPKHERPYGEFQG